MKYTEQDLKDEYEQAIKRKGKLYAEGYIEGLKDAQTQALTIPDVVGQSEQLLAFKEWERDKCRLPWDAEPKEIVEQYLSQ